MDRNPIFMDVPTELADFLVRQRHVLCPNYSMCLDEAVSKNQYFDCGECAFKVNGIKAYPLMNQVVPGVLKSSK